MCKHRYTLIRTKIVKISTFFCTRQITTEFYKCMGCKNETYVKKELLLDKYQPPPLTILEHMN
jgi:hypothetical protein